MSSSISFDVKKKKSGYLPRIKCHVMKEEKKYQKGYFIGIGIAIGLPIGIPIGLALGNIALGPAMGLPIGLVIGLIMEKRLNKNPIELSEEDKDRQKKLSWFGILIGVLLIVSIVTLFLAKLGG